MAIRAAAYILGWFFTILTVGHIFPMLIALWGREYEALIGLSESALILAFISGAVLLSFRSIKIVHNRKTTLSFLLSLFIIGPIGAGLPFLTTGVTNSFWVAYFEGVSGLTTTGVSALVSQDQIPTALLIWRIFIEWLGGLSILLIAALLIPLFGVGGASYVMVNLPHGEGETLTDRLRSAFQRLGQTYASITAAFAIGLWILGLPFLDGLTLAMSAIATGGYTLHAAGLDVFNNGLAEGLIAAAMITGALNFTLVRGAARGRAHSLFQDQEIKTFTKVLVIATVFMLVLSAPKAFDGSNQIGPYIWNQVFLAISTLTTSGLTSAHTMPVSLSIIILLFALCIIGGSVVSTTGGIKTLRLHLLSRYATKELARLAHPHGVLSVKYRSSRITSEEMLSTWSLFIGLIVFATFGALMFAAFKIPFISAVGTAVAMLSSTGPLVGLVDSNFMSFHQAETGVLLSAVLLMIIGKLEVLLFLVPFFRLLNNKR